MPAGIFGTDAVSTQPAVALPTDTEGWFMNQLGGAGTDGTEVPDYWLNKFGGELVSVLEFFTSLDMTVVNQLVMILKKFPINLPPLFVQTPQGFALAVGATESVSVTCPAATQNGYLYATALVNLNTNLSGGGCQVNLSNSLTADASHDSTPGASQGHLVIVKVPAGDAVTFTLSVTNSSPASFDFTGRVGVVFVPTPTDTSF
jgi:hypothetical protein